MLSMRSMIVLAALVTGLSGCGAKVAVDLPPSGSGGGGLGGSSSTSSQLCPEGTCKVMVDGPCEEPSGPTGNGCCKCGPDGFCAAQCKCAAPDTPIATPAGERSIASLGVGDLVYSVDHSQIVAVPIVATHQTPVGADHRVVRVRLATGATIEVSGGHPTLDGRTFADLRRGGQLGGVVIVDVEEVPYTHDRTYDILAGSDSGGYFAGGALVGSTLRPAARVDP